MLIFNNDWLFAKDEPTDFSPVTIPHDWLIGDTHNLYASGIGYYKKTFSLDTTMAGKRIYLRFDGVMMNSTLFVNGCEVGQWKYGYTAFCFEITKYLTAESDNTILLKVDFQTPCSRWYSGAGIYRDVFLIIKNTVHFKPDGIYIMPRKICDGNWVVEVDSEADIVGQDFNDCHDGICINSQKQHNSSSAPGRISDKERAEQALEYHHTVVETGSLEIKNAKLWDIECPNLYHLKSELLLGGNVVDTVITRFGLREIEFSPDEGFFLNGRRVKLNGVCQHHDLGALGAAVSIGATRRQLEILRGMGVNAIRTAHNPPSQVFMELADEMGFLVQSELLDMWKLPKTKFDYARFFDEWIERDVASWIRRDRNCPSVIMWSIGNEIYDTHADFDTAAATLKLLSELVRQHDRNNHAPVTFCSNYMPWENTQKCADIAKNIGYNYAEELYHDHHAAHPDWVIYGGETCSIVQSRGVYHFPLDKQFLHDDDMQCSSLGNSRTSWGAKSIEKCITDDRDTPFSPGQFLWSGFDYIGEPTPYHTKNSYFGQIDTAGFPKDSYYIFKSAWSDYITDPFVHIFPYWDFSPGQLIDVRVCTNAPKAELFFNGKSLGDFKVDHKSDKKLVGDFRIAYEPGELKAVAYDESGQMIAETFRRSFGDAAGFDVKTAVCGELAFCEISAYDKNGNPVENANTRVNIFVSGGVLLGTDNGDSTDYDQYTSPSRRLFSGKLLAIIKPDTTNQSTTAKFSISITPDKSDIPIRKIELISDGFHITARTYPHDAAYDDLIWRLTDSAGIDSPLGTIEPAKDGRSAVITPRGDGEVFVRCGTKNGGGHISLYSQLQLAIKGFGKPALNPYEFIVGGLYSLSNAELTNGNERGVATLRKGASHVGFADIDFGAFGSDEFTLSLFAMSRDPVMFEVWEGMPEQGGELLSTLVYDKGSVWNTYIDAVFKLPRRLRDLTTLCFVFNQKVHIGGFVFKRQIKAFETLYAADNDLIYGDSFVFAGSAIEHIGNNVTLVYNDMDFGGSGAGSVEVCRRCARKNSFQVLVTDSDGTEFSTMIETDAVAEYAAARYPLSRRVTGLCTVSFVFLPGCDVDIEWIRFSS